MSVAVKCWHTAKMEEGVGNAPTSGLSRSCFRDRCSQLVSGCLPEMVRVAGLAPWWPCASTLLLPRPWPRANARRLLTAHPGIGCQTWTRTKTNGLTDRRATLTPPGNGAADRIPTCMVPFRRRMPHVFSHGSNSESGQRGRICTCGHPVPSRACCCYTTRCSPRCAWGTPGTLFHGECGTHTP